MGALGPLEVAYGGFRKKKLRGGALFWGPYIRMLFLGQYFVTLIFGNSHVSLVKCTGSQMYALRPLSRAKQTFQNRGPVSWKVKSRA